MPSSISLGMEFVLPTQRLIKQALCVLPLPLRKVFKTEQGAKARGQRTQLGQEFCMVAAHGCFSSSPRDEVGVPGLRHLPCRSSWCSGVMSVHPSTVRRNGKIKGLCPALPGCENSMSSSVSNAS